MIRLRDVEMGFGAQLLYKDVELFIGENDRIGLVGPNGSGKSTLLKLITGLLEPEKGKIERKRGITISYLPQTKVVLKGRTVLEEALSGFTELRKAADEMRRLEAEMQKGGDLDSTLKRYAHLQETYEREAYTCESKTRRMLAGLGFTDKDISKSTSTQSGGFQMRVALAKLLLSEPDLMLLDEPTNYLDIASIEGFEEYLRGFKGAFVLTAHDRWLLDECVVKIWATEKHRIEPFNGNYSFYVAESEKARRLLEKRKKEQEREVQKARRFVDRFGAKARTARRAKSKEKALERLERIELVNQPKAIHLKFPEAERIYGKVIATKGLSKRFGSKTVCKDVDLSLVSSERVAVLGANGQGKTTLLKMIAGQLKPSSGSVWRSQKIETAFYTQGAEEELRDQKTVLEEIQNSAMGYTASELRHILGAFLFSGDDIAKPIGVLSGGERTRLAIVKVLLRPSNLLILDEPTNHLDIRSRDVLEEAILAYSHTVLFAAHDRFMIDRLATKTLIIENGDVKLYLGNYSYTKQDNVRSSQDVRRRGTVGRGERDRRLAEKERRVKELEREMEDAKASFDLQRARELWEEYVILRRDMKALRDDPVSRALDDGLA